MAANYPVAAKLDWHPVGVHFDIHAHIEVRLRNYNGAALAVAQGEALVAMCRTSTKEYESRARMTRDCFEQMEDDRQPGKCEEMLSRWPRAKVKDQNPHAEAG